jgi:hypothetical protein
VISKVASHKETTSSFTSLCAWVAYSFC